MGDGGGGKKEDAVKREKKQWVMLKMAVGNVIVSQ